MHRISIGHGRFNKRSFNFNIRNTSFENITQTYCVFFFFFESIKCLWVLMRVWFCAHRSMTSVQSYDRKWIISCVSSKLCTLDSFFYHGRKSDIEEADTLCRRKWGFIWRAWWYKYCLLSSTDSIQKSCGFSKTVCTAYLNSQRL